MFKRLIPARQRQILYYFNPPKVACWRISEKSLTAPLDQRPYYLRVEDRVNENHFARFDAQGIPIRGTLSIPLYNITTISAYAFANWNLWLSTKDTEQRDRFLHMAEWLVSHQQIDGGWYYQYDHRSLKAPWLSGMAQGEGTSVMARAFALTGDNRYRQAGLASLSVLGREVPNGGVCRTMTSGARFYEELPSNPPSFILNGFLYALFGIFDWIQEDKFVALPLWEAGYRALIEKLPSYDMGYWSRYDLWSAKRIHPSSFAYHDLHLAQLTVMQQIAPHQIIHDTLIKWEQARANLLNRLYAAWGKILYSLEST